MAVPTGSGTETLHSHLFSDVDANQDLIFGVQHHVYTVLSILCYCGALNATTDVLQLQLKGHDGHGGGSDQTIRFAQFNIQVGETAVWNDKFIFNGYEPSGTNVLDASEQIAIAAQGGSIQKLQCDLSHATDDYDLIVSYLDQDWT